MFDPALPGTWRKVIQQIVKPMVAQLRRLHWPQLETLFQVSFEEAIELCVRFLARGGGDPQSQHHRNKSENSHRSHAALTGAAVAGKWKLAGVSSSHFELRGTVVPG